MTTTPIRIALAALLTTAAVGGQANEPGLRWCFRIPTDAATERAHTERLARIDAWWKRFAAKTPDFLAWFRGEKRWDLTGWMTREVRRIHPGIVWEFGPGLRGGHRLVISAEGERALEPLVVTIIERAPTIDGWEFYPYRLPEGQKEVAQMLRARGLPVLDGARVVVKRGDYNLVDLTFIVPGNDDAEGNRSSALVATEILLGELWLNRWIGAIEVVSKPDEAAIALADLRTAVRRQIDAIRDALPASANPPDEEAPYTIWQIDAPQGKPDYARRDDLYIASSVRAPLWTATQRTSRFDSMRFSRHGEIFCYVKLDAATAPGGEEVAWRSRFSDAIDRALAENGLGHGYGGGTGHRYAYIDLAIREPERALPIIVKALRDADAPKRSWILFFDETYANEWVGVAETPIPPPTGASTR